MFDLHLALAIVLPLGTALWLISRRLRALHLVGMLVAIGWELYVLLLIASLWTNTRSA